jgi:hypothetical protein
VKLLWGAILVGKFERTRRSGGAESAEVRGENRFQLEGLEELKADGKQDYCVVGGEGEIPSSSLVLRVIRAL